MGGDDDHRVHPDRPGNCARTRHEPSADSPDPPGRVSQRSTHLIITAWPRSRSSRHSNSSDEIPSLHWPLPPLIAGRKLASFACPISPRFALNCDLQTINVRANWLCFGTFRSSPAPCLRLHRLLATILNAPRFTLHAPRAAILRDQRGRVVRRPSPAGYCLAPTANCQRPNGARSRRAIPLFQYGTKPGDSCGQINRFFLARRRPTVDHSLVAGG